MLLVRQCTVPTTITTAIQTTIIRITVIDQITIASEKVGKKKQYNYKYHLGSILTVFFKQLLADSHNPYNGVVCNDTILATGVFSSTELWKLSKGLYKNPFRNSEDFYYIWVMYLFTASILDETSDNIDLVSTNESTIKLENPSGSSVSGSAAIAAYYCNSYPLTTSSPGLVTAVTAADRNSSMLVTGTYSNYSNTFINVNFQFT